ncbi:hypothetical protein BpHYR1_001786 [Brachionus plicatilis]|uniref:Uncharacterized protein n=1 Tax=Brachionus plicatilis TaxID=10195 RepID=A0A3M7RLJ6_BRAPC|nr:hypothetical protein BpHYR1_001786 [Brachionus plicatilis]
MVDGLINTFLQKKMIIADVCLASLVEFTKTFVFNTANCFKFIKHFYKFSHFYMSLNLILCIKYQGLLNLQIILTHPIAQSSIWIKYKNGFDGEQLREASAVKFFFDVHPQARGPEI